MAFAPVEEALEELRAGRFLLLWDEARQGGFLAQAAEKTSPQDIAFLATQACGLVCIALTPERLDALTIPLMAGETPSPYGAPFTVSVDAKSGATGISAYDRALTVRALLDPATRPEDLARPGHLFPLRCAERGVLERPGAAEAIVDLCRLAGLYPAGVLCGVLGEEGEMLPLTSLEAFAEEQGIKMVSVTQVIALRLHRERLVTPVARARLPTRYGEFTAIAFRCTRDREEYVALTLGDLEGEEPLFALFHQGCVPGEVFGAVHCACRQVLREGLEAIGRMGKGILLYIPARELHGFLSQPEGGLHPDPREEWHFLIGLQVLRELGVRRARIRLRGREREAEVASLTWASP